MRINTKWAGRTFIFFTSVLLMATVTFFFLKTYHVSAQDQNREQTIEIVETTEAVSVAVEKKANKSKKSRKSKVTLYTKKGRTYCRVNGKKAKNKIVSGKRHTYLTDKKGALVKGWTKYKKAYYYLGRKKGYLYSNTTVDGIRLGKSGKANITKAAKAKIETMIKARNIVNKITNPWDLRNVKLRKCFLWIAKMPYRRYRLLKPIYKNKGWEVPFANDIFDKGSGCCVSESSALAFMLHEAGYQTVYICHDSEHGWVEVNGLVYDALFARAKNWTKYYGCTYQTYGLYAVGKRKI